MSYVVEVILNPNFGVTWGYVCFRTSTQDITL